MDLKLAQLAEVATAVSTIQEQTMFLPRPVNNYNFLNPGFTPVAGALRKRNLPPVGLASIPARVPGMSVKRQKTSPVGNEHDVRFREYQAEIWSEKFEELCAFRQQYGHCHVPHTYETNAALAQWVKRQRYQYKLRAEGKRSTLSDERVRLLNDLGFIWNSHDAVWEERLNELILFKKIYGHCVVPSTYDPNPQLAVWVKRQRRQYKFLSEGKPTSMTSERIAKLEKLGFAWDCRKNREDGEEGEKTFTRALPPEKPQITPEENTTCTTEVKRGNNTKAPTISSGKSEKPMISLPRCEFLSFGSRIS